MWRGRCVRPAAMGCRGSSWGEGVQGVLGVLGTPLAATSDFRTPCSFFARVSITSRVSNSYTRPTRKAVECAVTGCVVWCPRLASPLTSKACRKRPCGRSERCAGGRRPNRHAAAAAAEARFRRRGKAMASVSISNIAPELTELTLKQFFESCGLAPPTGRLDWPTIGVTIVCLLACWHAATRSFRGRADRVALLVALAIR